MKFRVIVSMDGPLTGIENLRTGKNRHSEAPFDLSTRDASRGYVRLVGTFPYPYLNPGFKASLLKKTHPIN